MGYAILLPQPPPAKFKISLEQRIIQQNLHLSSEEIPVKPENSTRCFTNLTVKQAIAWGTAIKKKK